MPEHDAAGPPDVADIALADAVVDHVTAEVRQVQVPDGLDHQQHDDEAGLPGIGPQERAEEPG